MKENTQRTQYANRREEGGKNTHRLNERLRRFLNAAANQTQLASIYEVKMFGSLDSWMKQPSQLINMPKYMDALYIICSEAVICTRNLSMYTLTYVSSVHVLACTCVSLSIYLSLFASVCVCVCKHSIECETV